MDITLGTSSFTGMPHANTVSYANDSAEVYFFTTPNTQVVRNITDNPYVSFTIDDYTTDWRKLRELQGVSRCRLLDEAERSASLALFAAKFKQSVPAATGLAYAMHPIEVHFVDYAYEDSRTAPALPQVTSRRFRIEEAPPHRREALWPPASTSACWHQAM